MSLRTYPNPSAGNCSIDFWTPEGGEGQLEVVDIAGKVVFAKGLSAESGFNALDISLSHLAAGSYVIKVSIEGKEVLGKWMKQ